VATPTLDWRQMNAWIAELLERRTGQDVATWNARVRALDPADEPSPRAWLTAQGVTGYPQSLLVMERYGYPDFLVASADALIDGQYADRPTLRPVLEAVLALASDVGDVTVQARKTYVSLRTPRRTFAAVQATTKRRVDLGLRLAQPPPSTRLAPAASMGSGQVTHRVALASVEDVDDGVEALLRHAYAENS
jgi:hypothetical protein